MLIEVYFQQVRDLIESCEIVAFFNLDFEKRGLYEGFIRGQINLKDNSLIQLLSQYCLWADRLLPPAQKTNDHH